MLVCRVRVDRRPWARSVRCRLPLCESLAQEQGVGPASSMAWDGDEVRFGIWD